MTSHYGTVQLGDKTLNLMARVREILPCIDNNWNGWFFLKNAGALFGLGAYDGASLAKLIWSNR